MTIFTTKVQRGCILQQFIITNLTQRILKRFDTFAYQCAIYLFQPSKNYHNAHARVRIII